ncbi:RNA polymerase sigma-54 factor [Ruegeria sp. EL01]|uniref:RNA polymerase factor sigma-54 n=1 Tax=Ruegeria sp. EL01 TaxID=2107578 RepID=UPI00210FC4F7|nr:RNA polymerase sigma-54 factor [Ruegeria sp. EL01]
MSFRHSQRQAGLLNHSMVQAFKLMRMHKVELLSHLAQAVEENPFLETGPEDFDLRLGGSAAPFPDVSDTIVDTKISLYQKIAEQLPLIFDSENDMLIALAFMAEIEPTGWLGLSVDEFATMYGYCPRICAEVLSKLQTVEPAGLFARDLKECLRLQAFDRGLMDGAMASLIDNLDALMDFDLPVLARKLDADLADIARCLDDIRKMDPKPGASFDPDETLARESDATVVVAGSDLLIELNNSSFPTVRLSRALTSSGSIKTALQDRHVSMIRQAKSLRSALEVRNSTALAVITEIFMRQREFLTRGYCALSPMRMTDIAEDTGLSEATISRVLSGLTIHCSQGNVTAKSLFCAPVYYGAQPQTKHVALQMIRSLIAAEDKSSPLSDGDIAGRVKRSGLSLSRRTVAKYRQSMGVSAPSVRRKNAEIAMLSTSARESKTCGQGELRGQRSFTN